MSQQQLKRTKEKDRKKKRAKSSAAGSATQLSVVQQTIGENQTGGSEPISIELVEHQATQTGCLSLSTQCDLKTEGTNNEPLNMNVNVVAAAATVADDQDTASHPLTPAGSRVNLMQTISSPIAAGE